jgi:hypothetical protein
LGLSKITFIKPIMIFEQCEGIIFQNYYVENWAFGFTIQWAIAAGATK